MIIQERMAVYINSLDTGNGVFLDELERDALRDDVPIIRQDMQSFLKVMLALHKPKKILEVGTAVGFSALLMADHTDADCRITTIEKYEKRIPIAKENFRKAGMQDRITLLEGDALGIMGSLTETYDMIFMDAAKGQYIHFFPSIMRLLEPGGVLVSDNILQDGQLVEPRYGVSRRNRTIHSRMREYLYVLKHTEGLESSVLTVGDGMTISVKSGGTYEK